MQFLDRLNHFGHIWVIRGESKIVAHLLFLLLFTLNFNLFFLFLRCSLRGGEELMFLVLLILALLKYINRLHDTVNFVFQLNVLL